jgi:SRSO17 transposase
LPKEWTDDPARLKAAHVPGDVGFATKPKIARRMIARAIAAKVPFSFVAADSVYGTGEIETLLRKAGKGYVLGVASNHVFHSWGKQQPVAGTASAIAQSLPKEAWRRLPSGEGTKGPRWHDWAYLELADLDASEYNDDLAGEWTRGLLIRRNIADGSLAFFSTWCPKGTSIQKLVSMEGHIEDSFETAKNELGLDHNETRSWHGWHRHVSLVMLAFAMMAVIRHRANAEPAVKKNATPAHQTSFLIRWSIQEIRRIAIKLAQRRISIDRVLAWSLRRRAHQADARRAHLRRKMQL